MQCPGLRTGASTRCARSIGVPAQGRDMAVTALFHRHPAGPERERQRGVCTRVCRWLSY